ncbi:oxidoreductase [Streptomyces lunaelactis]|uniref:Oxidoreductase n=1 Tax=Streptomyces lunaelactis TaxID=1535768 RepID=A0A2R4TBA4_9ACTN|nr:FAD-dependent oxidoreductase [Streptomyces lunaelactis]AVZ76374.1 oxidoreductase [Streptomyces lunaelactis]NUK88788.1 FAD-dependent monooxygenase [Streptomyces lunaelactis]NUL04271.1 FAD-dependent monooxygenase [Streptomyces lunaelactis]
MTITTEVCVVGGGPGGRALALALVRLGRRVVLLEQRTGGARAFRGESVSPDGVRLLAGLGLLERVREHTHEVHRLEIADGGARVLDVRFETFPYAYRHPVELAQPVLLSALADAAEEGGGCTVLEPAAAVGLLRDGGSVRGVRAKTPDGVMEIRADVTVGADGRYSSVRRMSGLDHGAKRTPLQRDVVWMKLPFPAAWDRRAYRVRISSGRHGLFLPSTDGTLRVGLNIPKGGLRELRSGGLGRLHARLAELAPELEREAADGIRSWSDTTLLDIFTTDVRRWSAPGVVLIGDAAHTLSPILGQGVNHALADAVALAPLLARALDAPRGGRPAALAAAVNVFQRDRVGAVRRSRGLQLRQERMFSLSAPPAAALRRTVYRALNASPVLQRRVLAPAYFPGLRPEPAAAPSRTELRT